MFSKRGRAVVQCHDKGRKHGEVGTWSGGAFSIALVDGPVRVPHGTIDDGRVLTTLQVLGCPRVRGKELRHAFGDGESG